MHNLLVGICLDLYYYKQFQTAINCDYLFRYFVRNNEVFDVNQVLDHLQIE